MPILKLIFLVIRGISALECAADTAVIVALAKKQDNKQKRHYKTVEQITKRKS